MKQIQNKLSELEIMLERTLHEARNSQPEEIEIYVNRIYALQDKYKELTGEKYKFKINNEGGKK